MIKFTSWSPSRLADYEQCPMMAKLKHLTKLCPICFRGKVTGGFDTPAVCDTCKGVIVKSDALERGTRIGQDVEKYLRGKALMLPTEVASKEARDVALKVRKAMKSHTALVEYMIVLDRDWRPTTNYSKSAWLRAKMDAAVFAKGKVRVIDWKTGGVDKATGAPRVDPKYDDQLSVYSTAALSALPNEINQVKSAEAALVFLDATDSPVVERPAGTLKLADLPKRQAEWTRRLLPMMNDDVLAPCPSNKCRWCDFSASKGGPCEF